MNRDIGNIQKGIHTRNQQKVYEAIVNLDRQVKLRDIMGYLNKQTEINNKEIVSKAEERNRKGLFTEDEMNRYIQRNLQHTISVKTVQRCILNDPRIEKDRRKYSISQAAKFESRYLDPESFGRQMLHKMIGEQTSPNPIKGKINFFVLRFGLYVFLNFIEAVRPFRDSSLSVKDREDSVGYWASAGIPLDYMFQLFQGAFDYRKPRHDWKTPYSEMSEDRIKEILVATRELFPGIYADFRSARRVTFGKTVKEVNLGMATDVIDYTSY